MINNVNSTPSFGSTRIPLNKLEPAAKELNNYFTVKGYISKATPQELADKIDFNQAVVNLDLDKTEAVFVGKDGGLGGADTFIGRVLKKIIPEAKFKDDIKPVEIDGPAIDLFISDLNI